MILPYAVAYNAAAAPEAMARIAHALSMNDAALAFFASPQARFAERIACDWLARSGFGPGR